MATALHHSLDLEQRYAHLLQPIRDLTKNWSIDIASQLEEYLEELEKVSVSFDNGATTMNFTEAALLIQGSTSVFGKKVEYLFNLTSTVLDVFINKKKKKRESNVDATGESVNAEDAEEEFLLLDDVISDSREDSTNRKCRLPSTLINAVPKTPLSQSAKNCSEIGLMPLTNKKGSIIAQRNDFHLSHTTNVCSTALISSRQDFEYPADVSPPYLVLTDAGLSLDRPTTGDVSVVHHDDSDQAFDDHHSDDALDVANDDGCPVANKDLNEESQVIQVQRCLRNREKTHEALQTPCLPKSRVDPLELIDEHSIADIKLESFKKGRPLRIPAHLQNRKRKASKSDQCAVMPINEFIEANLFNYNALEMGRSYLQSVVFVEFEDLVVKEMKRRRELLNLHKISLKKVSSREQLNDADDIADSSSDDDTGDGDHGDVQPQADVPTDVGQFRSPHTSITHEGSMNIDAGEVLTSYEELVQNYINAFLMKAELTHNKTELEKRVTIWEDRITPILDKVEARPPFDIHKYGQWLLDHLRDNAPSTFASLMSGIPPYEICRYFLSSLQLANNYNVEIMSGSRQGDNMSMRLLNRILRTLSLDESS